MGVAGGFGTGMKTDLALGRKWGLQHVAQGGENGLESGAIALFHFVNLAAEILVRGEHGADLEERTHDGDIDLDRAIAVKNAGKHCNAVFGECVGLVTTATVDCSA
jgi:hypothetical protein